MKQENLVLSYVLLKPFVRVNDEGLMLEMSAFQIVHDGDLTFINTFDKTTFSCLTREGLLLTLHNVTRGCYLHSCFSLLKDFRLSFPFCHTSPLLREKCEDNVMGAEVDPWLGCHGQSLSDR